MAGLWIVTSSTTNVLLMYQSSALPMLQISWLLLVSSVSLKHPDGWVTQGQEKGQIKSLGKYNWRRASLSVREYACLLFD